MQPLNSTTALYKVVWVRLEYDSVAEVFEMAVHVAPPSVDDCHPMIVPVLPLNVNVPLLDPEQAVVMFGETVPPFGGLTVMVTVAVLLHPFASVPVTV